MTAFATPVFNSSNFPLAVFPTLPLIGLSDTERSLIGLIERERWRNQSSMLLTDCYYRGEQIVTNLRIAIPAELERIRTLIGWGRVPVDPYVERMSVDVFRLGGSLKPAEDLRDIWVGNNLASEQKLAYTDMLAMGQTWWTVGAPIYEDDLPRICVQSPLNIAALWDPYTMKPRAGMEWWYQDSRWHSTFYASPDSTITMAQDDSGVWQLINRDTHNFGVIPIVRIANEARSNNRDGRSEITAPMMSVIDQGCRTMLGLEVSRELYAVPQTILLGAMEDAFVSADGTSKTAWETYINRILALERDDDGNVPEVIQKKPFDPAVFTKIFAELASQFSGMTGAPPQDLGLYTQGNPTSADAWQASEARRDRRARHKETMAGPGIAEVMQIATRFRNGGDLPDAYRRIEVDWDAVEQFNFAGASDGTAKLVNQGIWSATSDVTLKRTGLSAIERQQMAADREADAAQQELDELANQEAANIIAASRLEKALVPVPGEPGDPVPAAPVPGA